MTAPSIPADSRNHAIPDRESPPIQGDASCARERGRMGSSSVFLRAFKGSLMLRIGIISALVLGLNPGIRGTALAADKTLSPCKPLAKLRADFDAQTHFTTLTPGQFHFVEGVYVGSPTTPDGLPPGDGALLATHDGTQNGIILWTRGPLACRPLPISDKLIKLITDIKTGALDAEGNEL